MVCSTYFSMHSTYYLFVITSILILTACTSQSQAPPPNVVILLADDLGYNDISSYRSLHPQRSDDPPTSQTPNVDRLGAEGMRFTNYYCGAAVCSPSRSALITGRNATRVGIYNWIPANSPMHLRDEEVTIAEMLREADYRRGHFGKWHLTSEGMGQPLPQDQGFEDAFYTYNNAEPSHENPDNFFHMGEPVGELQGYACQLVMDRALNWLDTVKDSGQPFYLNVWFNEPHVQLAAPEELTSRHRYRQKYYGAIENMDLAIGRLLTYLDEQGLAENTIVIFSSDNGSQELRSNDPLRGEKCLNYEGGLRVPFVVRWPGKVPEGKVSEQVGSFTDVLPTLAALTGTKRPQGQPLDGMDLSAVWTGEASQVPRTEPVFFYRYFHDPVCALRDGDWVLLGYEEIIPYRENYDIRELANLKPAEGEPRWANWGFQPGHMDYIRQQEVNQYELYNLAKDPGQQNDVASEHPEIVERMKASMLALQQEMVQEGGDWFKR
jgi:arylsulfatase A